MILQTEKYPLLYREVQAHHPARSVSSILTILEEAEQGNLINQAELFSDMEERDGHIYAEMHKRKMAVAQLDWELCPARDAGEPEKKQVADLQAMLCDEVDCETLIFDLSSAIGHGYAASEIEWKRTDGGLWFPLKIHARPQRWFTVDEETRLEIRLRSETSSDGVPLQPFSWILHQHSAKTGYPATQGLFRVLALPYLFKNFAIKNWLRFCEMYGVPIRVLFHSETDPGRKLELQKALISMGQNGAALLQGGTQDDLVTVPTVTGDGEGFQGLINWCESTTSKAILGGTLTTQTAANGNRALGEVHDEVRQQIRDHDAKQLAATLTSQLIGAIIRINGLNIRARWKFDTQEPEDLSLYADSLPKLVAVGMRIPSAWAHDKLRIPVPEGDEDVLETPKPEPMQQSAPNSKPGKFAALAADDAPRFTPEQEAVERIGDGLLSNLSSPIDPERIHAAIRAARDPEDLERRLAVILTKSKPREFESILSRALFACDVMGYVHAEGK